MDDAIFHLSSHADTASSSLFMWLVLGSHRAWRLRHVRYMYKVNFDFIIINLNQPSTLVSSVTRHLKLPLDLASLWCRAPVWPPSRRTCTSSLYPSGSLPVFNTRFASSSSLLPWLLLPPLLIPTVTTTTTMMMKIRKWLF